MYYWGFLLLEQLVIMDVGVIDCSKDL